MSETNGKPGADNPGITQAAHDAAVAQARADGESAAMTRIGAVLGAEGISGDGTRMAAALDLATKAPTMSAEDVTAFVLGNVSANAATDPAEAFEASRAGAVLTPDASAGLSRPGGRGGKQRADLNRSAIFAARRNQNKGA